jgi:hypothetical protein
VLKNKISICGLNCVECDHYKAAQGDVEKQKQIINIFKQKGFQISPEQTMCGGCRDTEIHWSQECKIRKCASERSLEYCYLCSGFVCEKLESFANDGYESHKKAVEYLKFKKRNNN